MSDWETITNWTHYKRPSSVYKLRSGPDGTIAFWHCDSRGYTLTHHLTNGTVVGPVGPFLYANDARKAMVAERREARSVA